MIRAKILIAFLMFFSVLRSEVELNYIEKARLLVESKDYQGAITVLRQAQAQYPESAKIAAKIGKLYFVLGDYPSAKSNLLAGYLAEPEDMLLMLGTLALKMDDKELGCAVIPPLMEAREKDPQYVYILLALGLNQGVRQSFYYAGVLSGLRPGDYMNNADVRLLLLGNPGLFSGFPQIVRAIKEYAQANELSDPPKLDDDTLVVSVPPKPGRFAEQKDDANTEELSALSLQIKSTNELVAGSPGALSVDCHRDEKKRSAFLTFRLKARGKTLEDTASVNGAERSFSLGSGGNKQILDLGFFKDVSGSSSFVLWENVRLTVSDVKFEGETISLKISLRKTDPGALAPAEQVELSLSL